MVHLNHAGTHGVKTLKGGNQLAGTENLDLQTPARHGFDTSGQVGGAAGPVHVEGRSLAVGAGHLPAETLLGMRDGGHSQRAGKPRLERSAPMR